MIVTWLHRADHAVLETHPRNDPRIRLTGVFATRSPDRPNPLGFHRVTVREISGVRLRIGPIEAIDGTPWRTFPTAGTFNYQCTNHIGMTGSVTVGP